MGSQDSVTSNIERIAVNRRHGSCKLKNVSSESALRRWEIQTTGKLFGGGVDFLELDAVIGEKDVPAFAELCAKSRLLIMIKQCFGIASSVDAHSRETRRHEGRYEAADHSWLREAALSR